MATPDRPEDNRVSAEDKYLLRIKNNYTLLCLTDLQLQL